jgi:hypothetical protein
MPRNYQPADQGGGFQGSQQPLGYDPVRAFDNSRVHKQRADEQIQNVQTLARGAGRQAQMDMATLQADQAAKSANMATLKGLLSLSSTAMAGYQEIQKTKAEIERGNAALTDVGFFEEPVAPTPQEQVGFAQEHTAVAAEAAGTAKVAEEYQQTGTLNGASISHALRENTAYKMLEGINGNAYSAMSNHGIYLAEAIKSIDPALLKSPADVQIILRQLNRQFWVNTGMLNAPRELQLRLADTMRGNTGNQLVTTVTTTIKAEQSNNLQMALGFVSSLTDNPKVPLEEVWAKASERYFSGNLGITSRGAANVAALEDVLQNLAENGDTTRINDLRDVPQVPGQAGTELQNNYDHIFDKYERASRKGAIDNYNLGAAEKDIQRKDVINGYFEDPSPEKLPETIRALRALGTPEAMADAERLSANGLSYDPQKKFELMELQQKGFEIPEDTLKQLLTDGTISAAEYKQFSKSGPEKASLKAVDDYMTAASAGLKSAMQGKLGPQDLTPEVRAELTIRHQMMVEDIRRSVAAEVKAKPALANDSIELGRLVEDKAKFFMSQPHYTLTTDAQKGTYFAGEISTDKRLARITVSPGVQDFTKYNPEQVFGKAMKVPRSEMDPTKDRFLTLAELNNDVKRILEEKNPSNRSRLFAKHLGLSSTAFVAGQLGVYNLPSLATLRQGDDSMTSLTGLTGDIPTAQAAMRAFKEMNFPTKGAAYLAGGLQQESSLDGMRSWDDKGARAGGIVSWRAGRLQAVERHFNRPIEQITEREQLKYMVDEMKRYKMPNGQTVHSVFMNPNATKGELERASYQFWGYGEVGERFNYAEQLLNGSFRSAPGVSRRSSVRGTQSDYVGSNAVVATGHRDQNQRPIKFSGQAASIWKQMLSDGMPFSPGDVTSSHRTEDDYIRIKKQGNKPAANSYHNHGEAIDAHGATGAWIRKHGHKYGWVANDYKGSHGGHYEFRSK